MILDSRDTYQTLEHSTGKLRVQRGRLRVPGHVDGLVSRRVEDQQCLVFLSLFLITFLPLCGDG